MTNKTPFGLYLVLAAVAIILLYSSGVSLMGIPGVVPEGQILVKVVDTNGAAVQGAIVYIIPRDNGQIYDILQKRVGYEAKCDATNSQGLCDFGMYSTAESKQIGIVCPAAFNYSLNSKEYNPVTGSSIGYSVQITCPPNKRPSVNDMIAGNHTIAQEYVPEAQVQGEGPVCFMNTYIDESCSESNYGDKNYYFNADIMSPRGFNVKQCWTRPEWIYAECLPGEVGIGGYCVSQASYFTNLDCNSIKPGYTRVGNFCVAPMPSGVTSTTIPGGVYTTTTMPEGGNVGGYDLNTYGLIGFALFICILVMYKRGKH
jgi:hypothetical protein